MFKKDSVTRGSGLLENFLAKQRVNKASKLFSKKTNKDRILDIGCGFYPYFLINSNFKEKYGVDPNTNLKELKDKKLFLKKMDVEKRRLPFKDNFFDVVTMLAVFEHINNDKLDFVLREIKRVLKKNGLFIMTTPAPWSDWLIHFLGRIYLISNEEAEDHKHNHSNVKINSLLQNIGFKKDNINSGFFELRMNMWFRAKK